MRTTASMHPVHSSVPGLNAVRVAQLPKGFMIWIGVYFRAQNIIFQISQKRHGESTCRFRWVKVYKKKTAAHAIQSYIDQKSRVATRPGQHNHTYCKDLAGLESCCASATRTRRNIRSEERRIGKGKRQYTSMTSEYTQ